MRGRIINPRVAKHGRVVDPPGQRSGGLGAVSGRPGDGVIGRVSDHRDHAGSGRMRARPPEHIRVELDRDHAVVVAEEPLDERPADAPAAT